MSKKNFLPEMELKYDKFLLSLQEDSPWLNIESTAYPDLLRSIIKKWHGIGAMSFSFSNDEKRFKKDFNIDKKFINSYLKQTK